MSVSNAQQFCTFYVDRQFFGVPVQQVQEVIRYQEMTRVPLVPHVNPRADQFCGDRLSSPSICAAV